MMVNEMEIFDPKMAFMFSIVILLGTNVIVPNKINGLKNLPCKV